MPIVQLQIHIPLGTGAHSALGNALHEHHAPLHQRVLHSSVRSRSEA